MLLAGGRATLPRRRLPTTAAMCQRFAPPLDSRETRETRCLRFLALRELLTARMIGELVAGDFGVGTMVRLGLEQLGLMRL